MTFSDTPLARAMPAPRYFFAVSLGAAVFFAVWTWFVHGDALPAFDVDCAQHWETYSDSHRGPWDLMVFLTDLGGIGSMTLFTIMGVIWLTTMKQRTAALAWIGIVIGGALLNQAVKETFGRPRPSNPDRAVLETNVSYPSGHSMGSAIGFGLLGYLLVLPQPSRQRRLMVVSATGAIVLAVGFSRIYLRAHWFSDVVGGFSLGLAWLFLCLGWLEHRRAQAPLPSRGGREDGPPQISAK
jgi:undecaprenyl-diphosphatase